MKNIVKNPMLQPKQEVHKTVLTAGKTKENKNKNK